MSRPQPRKPPARLVVFGSLSLFASLFVVLLFQLSANASPSKTQAANSKATAAKARPAKAETGVTDAETQGPPAPEELEGAVEEPEYEEPAYEEAEYEYEEPEYSEPEYVEPEYEEAPPVVTSSS